MRGCAVEDVLWPEELQMLEADFCCDWRDLTRQEVYMTAVYGFALALAAPLLGPGDWGPAFLFSERAFEILRGIEGRAS